MQVGVCTWTFGPRPIDEIAERVKALNFDGVELHGDLERFNARDIRTLFDKHGLKIFSLTPDNLDIVHSDTLLRQDAINYYKRLIDFAAELSIGQENPTKVSCHGDVGKVKAFTTQAEEEALLIQVMLEITEYAALKSVPLVFEVLNRYESNLINNCDQAIALIESLGQSKMSILLDCYHMNIEEADLAQAILNAGSDLGLFHIADSNRRGIGEGHTNFNALMDALKKTHYDGPVILEMSAPGPNPFTPVKGDNYLKVIESDLGKSLKWLADFK